MAQPTPYNRLKNFNDYALANPAAPYNGADHDAELNAVETTLDGLCANLQKVQRDDGLLANLTVHPDALNTATLALIASDWTPRGLWVTATEYAVGDVVEESAAGYVCAEAHTSGVFATDHAAGKWVALGLTTLPASSVSVTPSGGIASTTVQLAIQELDTEKAALAGSASQVFSAADGTDDKHAVNRSQIQNGSLLHVAGGGTGDAITGTLATGGVVSLNDGMEVSVRAPGSNTLYNPTFNLTLDATPTGAITVVRGDTRKGLRQGDIGGAGHEMRLKYRSSPSSWLLLNPSYAPAIGPRNRVLAGDFWSNPFQDGVSFAAAANGAHVADGWLIQYVTSAVVTVLRTDDGPALAAAGVYSPRCLHVDITTADGSIAAGDFFNVVTPIEGYEVADFGFGQAGTRYATLSFHVKATKTGVHCVSFRNNANDRSYVAEYTVAQSDVWEYKTITIPVDTTGTWDRSELTGVRVAFCLAAGGTFQTAAGAWTAGNFMATANQVNELDSTSNNFKIDLVQFEAGETATPYDWRSRSDVLDRAQRHLEKSFDIGVAPAQAATSTGAFIFSQVVGASTAMISPNMPYRVRKRSTPTVTLYNIVNANAQVHNLNTVTDCSASTAMAASSESSFSISMTTPGGSAAGNTLSVHWRSSARLT